MSGVLVRWTCADRDLQDFAEAHKLGFIETSAKSNKNVEDMFQLIANKIFEAKRDAPDSEDSESD